MLGIGTLFRNTRGAVAAQWRRSGGAVAAEMALLLPLLVTLLFVTFEGGYFLWNQQKVIKGVRDGARYAGRLSFTNYDCDGTVSTTAQTTIRNLTRTGQLGDGAAAVIPGWTVDGVTVSVVCDAGRGGIYEINAGNAPIVIVGAVAPYPTSPLTDIAAVFGFDPSSISLRAEAQSPVMGL